VLDTNTIMDYPNLGSYQFPVPGPFLIVIPQVVDNEIIGLSLGNADKATKRKASYAKKTTGDLYKRGNPAGGIDLGNGLWLITVSSVRPPDAKASIENDQVRKFLGRVDSAILRFAEFCMEDVPDIPVILITKDADLSRVAKVSGLPALTWPDLDTTTMLEAMQDVERPTGLANLDTYIRSFIIPDGERPATIALTLEELRSDGDRLIARGTGRITWIADRYPFRWEFPFRNAEKVEDWESTVDPGDVMPLENLDFFGKHEQIPEQVRRFVCTMLEKSDLQSPRVVVRLMFDMIVGNDWGYSYTTSGRVFLNDEWLAGKSATEIETAHELGHAYFRSIQTLSDGTAGDIGTSYVTAFEAFRALSDYLGEEVPGDFGEDPVTGLQLLLSIACETWNVGQTIEQEFTYEPFQLPQEDEEEVEDVENGTRIEEDDEANEE
jgi:hypothetical protein